MAHTDYGTDTRIPKGVGEWLTRIMARIHGYPREWGRLKYFSTAILKKIKNRSDRYSLNERKAIAKL
ncbi:MAG: hypothetical protein SWX82_27155 [Cyanobacteriota bacterium]|nr:hypothetical protein [Cyanobacteriota bacterium]